MTRKAVFFDRDDTLIECNGVTPSGDLGDPSLVSLKPGAREAIEALKKTGFVIVVITNQGGVARGNHTCSDVFRVNARLNELLGNTVDAFRFCPWHPKGTLEPWTREHPWRKPSPGMILDASASLRIDLAQSWVVGDADRDCEAGKRAGCRTILIGEAPSAHADSVTPDLAGAVRTILGH